MDETFIQRAHGRVNLIGEHTDYNGGWVLPTAIAPFTQVSLKKRTDKKVTIHSSKGREFSYELGKEIPTHDWSDYLKGSTKILGDYLQDKAQHIYGFEAWIESTVPEGSGLSSSAALEISFLKAIRSAWELQIGDVELALLGQRVENEFVGARVGIMDQMAVSLAGFHMAIFLDTKNLTYEQIELPYDQMDLVIINSGISHKLSAKGGYNERRAQCEEACERLKIKLLRDITLEDLQKANLPEILMKRARHVVSENQRVFQAVNAIKKRDLSLLGKLFLDSHRSMRDDYEVSIPGIDLLVELMMSEKDCLGARLTGGGFGGSIVAITQKNTGQMIAEKVARDYEKRTKIKASVLS
jgi:galactokinase